MAYNGELRELHNDLDKKFEVDKAERIAYRKADEAWTRERVKATKEYRAYMELKINDILDRVSDLPCKASIQDLGWMKKADKDLWIAIKACFGFATLLCGAICTWIMFIHR